LRLLAGFEYPDHGEILIEGRSMNRTPPHHRPVNLVFQNYALFPHLTVFKNVSFGLEMRHVAPGEITSRVAAALAMVRLQGKETRVPSQLSGGEQQRVARARALVNRPAVVLLDEPLGALDQQLRQEMQVELKTIQEQAGLTFMCVTHHQEEALTMSDRLAVMNRGRILQIGSPREIYESPISTFVATFIGQSNQMAGRVEAVSAATCRIQVSGLPSILARSTGALTIGDSVTLIVRPERIELSRESLHAGYDNAIPARIEKVIYNGSENQYWFRLTDHIVWKAHELNARPDRKGFVPGESILVRWHAVDGIVLTE
jgi:spermidine/putrescine transport system ATP-binding protein